MSADKLARGMPYIVAEKVTKSFGSHQVLKGVSTQFCTGEVTVIIGASGSGKSTLLRAINRLEPHDGGRITIDGVEVTDNEATLQKQRCEVGMVFQHYALFRHMTVFENVAFGLRVKPRSQRPSEAQIREKVLSLLKLVQLDWIAERFPSQLSGGQRQRIALARALAVEPKVLLLDEPCSALDPISTAKIEELIAELKNDYTVVIVTHNMQQAARCSDYTAYMYLGDLVEFGDTEQMFFKPQRKETEDYITGRFG